MSCERGPLCGGISSVRRPLRYPAREEEPRPREGLRRRQRKRDISTECAETTFHRLFGRRSGWRICPLN
eukprot:8349777-Pyramimonas_sp.AAC.1